MTLSDIPAKQFLNGLTEDLGDVESKKDTGSVVSAFDRNDRLTGDTNLLGQFSLGELEMSAAILQRFTHDNPHPKSTSRWRSFGIDLSLGGLAGSATDEEQTRHSPNHTTEGEALEEGLHDGSDLGRERTGNKRVT